MIKKNKILEMFWPNAGRFQDQDYNSCQLGQKDKDPPSLGRIPSLPPLPEGAAVTRPFQITSTAGTSQWAGQRTEPPPLTWRRKNT